MMNQKSVLNYDSLSWNVGSLLQDSPLVFTIKGVRSLADKLIAHPNGYKASFTRMAKAAKLYQFPFALQKSLASSRVVGGQTRSSLCVPHSLGLILYLKPEVKQKITNSNWSSLRFHASVPCLFRMVFCISLCSLPWQHSCPSMHQPHLEVSVLMATGPEVAEL